MVNCSYCGIYLPKSEAVGNHDKYFCCNEHSHLYLNSSSWFDCCVYLSVSYKTFNTLAIWFWSNWDWIYRSILAFSLLFQYLPVDDWQWIVDCYVEIWICQFRFTSLRAVYLCGLRPCSCSSLSMLLIKLRFPDFNSQLTIQVVIDIVFISIMLYASGGYKAAWVFCYWSRSQQRA